MFLCVYFQHAFDSANFVRRFYFARGRGQCEDRLNQFAEKRMLLYTKIRVDIMARCVSVKVFPTNRKSGCSLEVD